MNEMPRAELDAERSRRIDEPFPGGESWRDAVARVVPCLRELATERGGQRVVLIGHVATRWALDHHILGVPLEQLVAAPFAWQPGREYTLRTNCRE
jgi:2,3-bisphosphoglycerate-dependent phosphoglycerate mutase